MAETSARVKVLEHQKTSYQLEKSVQSNELFYRTTKRGIDIITSVIALMLTSPFFLLISICYSFGELKGPVLFKQVRIGKNGKEFYIYKFRSMVINAEEKLRKDPKLFKKYVENGYKLEPHEDPRITKIGTFLRKTSLDELPQLINVIKGEMSLVGPRPVVVEELIEYGDKRGLFLSVKPGVTGYWQVSGRSEIGYPERVDLELHYVHYHSFLFDIKIILKTIWIVLLKKGAY